MRRFHVPAAAALLCTLAGSSRALAHIPLYGVGTQTRFIFKEDRVLLTFDLSYDSVWAQGEMVRADKDRSSTVEPAEADAYLKSQWEERIASRIAATVDGAKAEIRKVAERHDALVGEIFPTPFSLFYELEVIIPAVGDGSRKARMFEFEDLAVQEETRALPRFLVPYQGHGSGEGVRFLPEFLAPLPPGLDTDGYWLEGRKLSVRFSFEGDVTGLTPPAGVTGENTAPAGAPPQKPEVAPPLPPGPARESPNREEVATAESSDWVHRAFRDFGTSGWAALVWALIATLYGAGHALTPGHGKTMVAAYLIGTKGTVRDAVILGTVTTITHTGSVFLFGGSIFLILNASTRFSEGHIRNMIIVGTQLVSGALLLALGIGLFVRRTRGSAGHGHDHHHGHHGHVHSHGHHKSSPLPAPPPAPDGLGQDEVHHHHHDPHHHDHHDDHHHDHHHAHDHAHHHGHGHHHGHDHHHGHGHHHHDPATHHPAQAEHSHGPGHAHAEHSHDHHTDPHHHHGHAQGLFQGGRPHLRELLALGFSGGLVPCPAGLVAILLGLQTPEKLLFALGLLVFFSVGLGSVLVAIGVFLVTGKMLLSGSGGGSRILRKATRVLPILSSLFIAGLGAFFLVRTVSSGRTEIAAMLRLAAEWLQR